VHCKHFSANCRRFRTFEDEVDLLWPMAMNPLFATRLNYGKRCGQMLGAAGPRRGKQIRSDPFRANVARCCLFLEDVHRFLRLGLRSFFGIRIGLLEGDFSFVGSGWGKVRVPATSATEQEKATSFSSGSSWPATRSGQENSRINKGRIRTRTASRAVIRRTGEVVIMVEVSCAGKTGRFSTTAGRSPDNPATWGGVLRASRPTARSLTAQAVVFAGQELDVVVGGQLKLDYSLHYLGPSGVVLFMNWSESRHAAPKRAGYSAFNLTSLISFMKTRVRVLSMGLLPRSANPNSDTA
jgi:hypothetical protein